MFDQNEHLSSKSEPQFLQVEVKLVSEMFVRKHVTWLLYSDNWKAFLKNGTYAKFQ